MNKKPGLSAMILILILLSMLLAACGSDAEDKSQEQAAAITPAQNVSPTEESPTPVPTEVPATDTPEPPTATPQPPTATPEPPTPTPEPPTPTPLPEIAVEDLYGRWSVMLFTLTLNPDGTYLILYPAHVGETQPQEFGTYSLEDGVITFRPEGHVVTDSPTHGAGCNEPFAYAASFSEGDPRFLRLSLDYDNCDSWRAGHWTAEPIWQLLEKFEAG